MEVIYEIPSNSLFVKLLIYPPRTLPSAQPVKFFILDFPIPKRQVESALYPMITFLKSYVWM